MADSICDVSMGEGSSDETQTRSSVTKDAGVRIREIMEYGNLQRRGFDSEAPSSKRRSQFHQYELEKALDRPHITGK
jgi:hypothetical protein